MAEHLHFNAIFIILQQTAVRRPWELGAGSIWFYGSRSFYATSTGMLNGMAVCLMNRFKTQVSPRGCAVSSFLSSIYAEEIMCNNNCLVPTGWPGGPVPFPVREQRKIYCSRLDFILPLRLSHPPPTPHPRWGFLGLCSRWPRGPDIFLHQCFCSGSSSESVMSTATLINCALRWPGVPAWSAVCKELAKPLNQRPEIIGAANNWSPAGSLTKTFASLGGGALHPWRVRCAVRAVCQTPIWAIGLRYWFAGATI